MKIGSTVNVIKIKKPCLERSHVRILFCISSATSNGNSHNGCPIYVYTLFFPLLCIFSHLSPSLKRKYLLLLECVEVCTQGSASWKCSSLFHGGKTSSSFIFSTDSRLYPLPVVFLDGKKLQATVIPSVQHTAIYVHNFMNFGRLTINFLRNFQGNILRFEAFPLGVDEDVRRH